MYLFCINKPIKSTKFVKCLLISPRNTSFNYYLCSERGMQKARIWKICLKAHKLLSLRLSLLQKSYIQFSQNLSLWKSYDWMVLLHWKCNKWMGSFCVDSILGHWLVTFQTPCVTFKQSVCFEERIILTYLFRILSSTFSFRSSVKSLVQF